VNGGHLDRARMARLRGNSPPFRKEVFMCVGQFGAIAAGMESLAEAAAGRCCEETSRRGRGQPRLMETYRTFFRRRGVSVAQVLLTREDFENKTAPERPSDAFNAPSSRGHSYYHENDTVAVEEIRVGDNDTLAAYVAVNVKAGPISSFDRRGRTYDQASASWSGN